jgi:hypothetical protein
MSLYSGLDVDGDVLGEDDFETAGDVVGAALARGGQVRAGRLMLPAKPGWREGRLTAGLYGPSRGQEPLALEPDVADPTFTTLVPIITFTGKVQRPFRPERLIAQVRRNADAAAETAILVGRIFCGTYGQQMSLAEISLENFDRTSFGVRLALRPIEPGVEMVIIARMRPALTDADSKVTVDLNALGQSLA